MGDSDSGNMINVTSRSIESHINEPDVTLKAGITTFCSVSLKIRDTINSALGKTSFSEVTASQMIGKGSIKVTKEFLAESVITLTRLAESLDPIVNANPIITCREDVPQSSMGGVDVDDLKSYLENVQTKLDSYDAIMQTNQEQIDTMVSNLTELVSSHSSTPAINTSPSVTAEPNTISPHARPSQPPCEPYIKYVKDAIPETLTQSLKTFVSEHQDDFVNIGGCRDTMYYGEFGYRYSGGSHDAKDMPAPIKDLLDSIRAHCSKPDAPLNSCLVTRYKSGADHIPPHRDDEPVFNPNSEIVTVSVGAQREMKFTDNTGTNCQMLSLDSNSVLVSSRLAQDFWMHSIEKCDDPCEERLSFTFRHISPHFLNSTVIVGDSNTRLLQFGDGKGKFGKWMPGERKEAFHIEDIPDPINIGPYRNIVLHTGINNIKNRNSRSINELGNILEQKCKAIIDVYPKCKVFISLLLPTKLDSINHRVKELNNVLRDISHSHKNISVIDHPFNQLCNNDGCLKDEFGRFDKESGTPLSRDALHLGKKGLRLLAVSVKSCVMGRYKRQGQGQQRASAERGNNDGYQST